MRLFLLVFSLFLPLLLTAQEQSSETIEPKVLYQSYEEFPQKIYNGQVFAVTVKTLAAQSNYEDIFHKISGGNNVILLSDEFARRSEDHTLYDTFYLQAVGEKVTTPQVKTSLIFEGYSAAMSQVLDGKELTTVTLNPDANYCGVSASLFSIVDYKTTQYDEHHNIVVFTAQSEMANLADFYLNSAQNQGMESLTQEWPANRMTYFAILPNHMQNLTFTYFNLNNNRFEKVLIPIVVTADRVSTQTDLAPMQNEHLKLKLLLTVLAILLLFILFLLRGRYGYLLLMLLPFAYGAQLIAPQERVCVAAQANIYLLPMERGTVFKRTEQTSYFDAIGNARGYTKVRLANNHIGWIKHEDRCSH